MDRGFGRCMVIKKFGTYIKRYANGTVDESRGPIPAAMFPDGENNSRYKKQQYLDPDGIAQVGERLDSGHVLVNKFSPVSINADPGETATIGLQSKVQEYKASPMTYKGAAPAIVDKVLLTSSENETFIVKVL